MKLWVLSDLHYRIADARAFKALPVVPEADVCICVGDITDGLAGIEWCGEVLSRRMPTVLVLGNHDIYGEALDDVGRKARRIGERYPDLHILDDRSVVLGGVRFVGGTLWTDFKLFESDADPISEAACRSAVRREMPDYMEIYAFGSTAIAMGRLATPLDQIAYHKRTLAFFNEEFKTPFAGRTVVATHHAPSRRSIHADYAREPSSAAFATNLDADVERWGPKLWVHGHVHHSLNYEIGQTRVLCNPRGYGTLPNKGFVTDMVVEV